MKVDEMIQFLQEVSDNGGGEEYIRNEQGYVLFYPLPPGEYGGHFYPDVDLYFHQDDES